MTTDQARPISTAELAKSNVATNAVIMRARTTVGENIRAARKEKGWTQEKLSHRAKLSASHLSAIERGKVNIYLDTMARIAKALKVRLGQLMSGVE